jgi:hypothetical protein
MAKMANALVIPFFGLVLNPTHGDAFNNETCSSAGAFLFEFWFECVSCESVGGV